MPRDELLIVAGDFNDWGEKLDAPMARCGLHARDRAGRPAGALQHLPVAHAAVLDGPHLRARLALPVDLGAARRGLGAHVRPPAAASPSSSSREGATARRVSRRARAPGRRARCGRAIALDPAEGRRGAVPGAGRGDRRGARRGPARDLHLRVRRRGADGRRGARARRRGAASRCASSSTASAPATIPPSGSTRWQAAGVRLARLQPGARLAPAAARSAGGACTASSASSTAGSRSAAASTCSTTTTTRTTARSTSRASTSRCASPARWSPTIARHDDAALAAPAGRRARRASTTSKARCARSSTPPSAPAPTRADAATSTTADAGRAARRARRRSCCATTCASGAASSATYRSRSRRRSSEILIANAYFVPGVAPAARAAARGAARRAHHAAAAGPLRVLHAAPRQPRAIYGALLDAGIEIIEYEPSFLHAKVAVFDGRSGAIATVGSSNLDPLSLLLAREANVFVRDEAFGAELRGAPDRRDRARSGAAVESRRRT